MNTQVFEEKVKYNKNDNPPIIHECINFDRYIPILIRSNYENLEDSNADICKRKNFKYVIDHNTCADKIN
jgi:hypothetical protein